ncbi:hypothetical protein L1987_64540 [Smallanthus sonchifolius]|uniref:Uncharacterized protein n=1 Tax=Smallanthus sonchifolius TaxID=185202 RepID=A0ACB9BRY9_9ASTR|nr:hypothetical protein L1987_64540 [Smallanthus sonchifolius]
MTEAQFQGAVASEVSRVLQTTLPGILDDALRRRENHNSLGNQNKGTNGVVPRTEDILHTTPLGNNKGTTRTRETVGMTNHSTGIHRHGCNYKNFGDYHPKPFNGKKDAIAALQWITSMETVIKMIFDFERYCPQNVVDKIKAKFMWFEAGTMTHQEYTTKFNEMAKLVPHLVTPGSRRVKCYIQGLPPKVCTLVKSIAPETIDLAMEKSAVMFYEVATQEPLKVDDKRKPEEVVYKFKPGNSKLLRRRGFNSNPDKANQGMECKTYQNGDEQKGKAKEVSGVSLIPFVNAYVVETASGEQIRIAESYPGCVIRIGDDKVLITLVPMNLNEYEVILGMDWLNQAQIDCDRECSRLRNRMNLV